MPEEIKEVVEEVKDKVVEKEETKETPPEEENKETEETFDENDIDPEVRDYKPEPSKVEEEEDIDEEDKARISKIVQKEVGGTVEQMQRQIQIDGYFNAHPEEAKYRSVTEKYLNHPTYKNIPVHNIVAMVSAKDQQRIGAAKERQAQAAVAETKSPGNTARKASGDSVDWMSVSPEEFQAQKAKVLGRPS